MCAATLPPGLPGVDCDDGGMTPIPIPDALPFAVTEQTNCGAGNTYSDTCLSSYDGGDDALYLLDVISDAAIEGTMKSYHSLAKTTVPAGTYEGQTKDYRSFGIILVLFTHKNVPDDVAYNLLAMWLEGNGMRAKKIHPKAYDRAHVEFGLEAFKSGKHTDIYHPGDLKFWKEVAARRQAG